MSHTELQPWIENVAAADVPQGCHHDCGDNAMLIQIRDPHTNWWPAPKHSFREVHQFEFLDADWEDGFPEADKIQQDQARALVDLLRHAQDQHMNVVVHCMAGVCRSGAVAEVGVMMGFRDVGRMRIPNVRVKTMMMRELGWTYDQEA
jgi:predicted protein tyrosine phosphatase